MEKRFDEIDCIAPRFRYGKFPVWSRLGGCDRPADLNTSVANQRVQCRPRDYFLLFIFNSIELHFSLINLPIGIEYIGIRKTVDENGNCRANRCGKRNAAA
ncbi:hypothetical protein [Burkholderia cepacia]|uniref:hypothetical protein n=1 Tax=Burkholderia cepacia TaxID=292 RepID=UPI0012D9973F|nr:hypothetical protein [Burkholderia cepacia]